MVNIKREGLGLLLKLGRAILTSEDSTEPPEVSEGPKASAYVDPAAEPMRVYWETDRLEQTKNNQAFIDQFLEGKGLNTIPDSTEQPVKESHYKYQEFFSSRLPDTLKHLNLEGVPETPKETGISSSGRDAGMVAGIVVAVISGVIILAALIAVVMYRHYVHRNVTSMNFDNPVYRKTTEDQFALEKNGYAPGSKLYPSTVGEEAQEPLNTPGTNDFV